MIAKEEDYNKIKETILTLYQEKFMSLVHEARDVSEDKTIAETRLKNLDIQAEKIKRDKFTLMIAGEAKSGKSTFINAYLGVDVLPMDVMQCTSTIVEIKYAPEMTLVAAYADGKETVVKDAEGIKAFLNKNAAVDDRYREIPVSIINEEIIAKKKGKMPSDREIDLLMEGIDKDKPSGMADEEYRAKVVQYIDEKSRSWDLVISKIEIGYPFKEEDMRGITIVDSPGVGAEGHVGDVTYKYITSADAIIFLKSIQGQDLDSSSFKQFITQKAVTKKKDVLFLALTRIAGEPEANVTRVYQEAVKRFKGSIQEEQILCIDSKAQMFYNQIKDFPLEAIEDLIKAQKKAGTLDAFIKVALFDADNDRDTFLKELQSLSRFKSVSKALNRFARRAHYVQLRDFLSNLVTASEQIASILNESIELYSKGIEDPAKLEKEIEQVTEDLTELQAKLNETLDKIAAKYRNNDGEIRRKADEVVNKYREAIDGINSSGAGRFQKLEELTFKQIEEFTRFQEQIRKEIVARCDKELVLLSDKGSIKVEVIRPAITPEMIEEIKKREEANAVIEEEITEGVTFWKVKKKVPRFSEDLHYNNVKSNIVDRIQTIKSELVVSLMKDVDAVCTVYRKELVKNIKDQKARLNQVKEDKRTNDEKRRKVQELRNVVDKFKPIDALIKAEKEGVEGCVTG